MKMKMNMKKYLPILIFSAFVLPQIVFAAWWNPLSWFNNWSFSKTDNQTQILEKRIADLEKKLGNSATSTNTTTNNTSNSVEKQNVEKPQKPKTAVLPPISTKTVIATTSAPIISNALPNPSSTCLPTKKSWDAFISSSSDVYAKIISLYGDTTKLIFGTTNKPSDFIALVNYDYSHMTAEKSNFSTRADAIRKLVDALPKPPAASDDDLQNIKNAYLNSVTDIQSHIDLAYQAFGIIANEKNGVSPSDITTTQSLLSDSMDASRKVFGTDTPAVDNIVNKLKTQLNIEQPNGCLYTFNSDNKTMTTTKDEQNFSLSRTVITHDQNYTEATLRLTTNLPIQISNDGNIKTVIRLNCSGKYLEVERIDKNTIQVTVNKTAITGNMCAFVYSGNGDEFKNSTVSLPW